MEEENQMSKMATKERKDIAPKKRAVRVVKPEAVAAVAVTDVPVSTEPVCAHRWRIESPNGAMSMGVCRICGAEKEFPNSAEDYLWERSVPQSRWTGRAESSGSDGY